MGLVKPIAIYILTLDGHRLRKPADYHCTCDKIETRLLIERTRQLTCWKRTKICWISRDSNQGSPCSNNRVEQLGYNATLKNGGRCARRGTPCRKSEDEIELSHGRGCRSGAMVRLGCRAGWHGSVGKGRREPQVADPDRVGGGGALQRSMRRDSELHGRPEHGCSCGRSREAALEVAASWPTSDEV